MARTNYTTVTALGADLGVNSAVDDALLARFITAASTFMDQYCHRRFYSRTETRVFDVPFPIYAPSFINYPSQGSSFYPRAQVPLFIDDDLLTVTTLTNGDSTVIASTDYKLYPLNDLQKQFIQLLPTSSVVWQTTALGNPLGAISVAGTWGYVNRNATDDLTLEVVAITEQACKEIAKRFYERRGFAGDFDRPAVTPYGVVLKPADLPRSVYEMLAPYVRSIYR